MTWVKRVMERGKPPVAAQYATTPNGAPFPLRSWPPDAAIDIQNLAQWTDRYSYPTAAARNAAIPAPYPGQLTYLQDTGTLQSWNGYVWVGDTAWKIPTGANGWSGATAAYRMDHTAMVSVIGQFINGAGSSNYYWIPPSNYQASDTSFPLARLYVGGSHVMAGLRLYNSATGHEVTPFTGSLPNAQMSVHYSYRASFKAVR